MVEKKRRYSQTVSLSYEFVEKVKNHILKDDKYKSIADFIRKAVELKMDIDNGKIHLLGFQNWSNPIFEKCNMINISNIIAGQNNTGIWLCKELPARNTQELDFLMGIVNGILNKYNKKDDDVSGNVVLKKKEKT